MFERGQFSTPWRRSLCESARWAVYSSSVRFGAIDKRLKTEFGARTSACLVVSLFRIEQNRWFYETALSDWQRPGSLVCFCTMYSKIDYKTFIWLL